MTAYLALLRHGKAEKADGNTSDGDRSLTQAGKRALKATLPQAIDLLPRVKTVRIWTSPLNRAVQTADVLAECLKSDAAEAHECLAMQDVALFESELEECISQAEQDVLVIAVGHEPMMGKLAERYLGATLPFGKGAIACMRLGKLRVEKPADSDAEEPAPELSEETAEDTPKPDSVAVPDAITTRVNELFNDVAAQEGADYVPRHAASASTEEPQEEETKGKIRADRLLWFMQGPESKRWQVLVDLEGVLATQYAVFRTRLGDFRQQPGNVDAVHDLRVSIRTLRSLVEFCKPFQLKKQNTFMQVSLRDIVRELSALREYDVLLDKLRDTSLTEAPDGVYEQSLVEAVALERTAESLRVLQTFSDKDTVKVLSQLDTAFDQVKWRESVESAGLSREDVRARFLEIVAAYEEQEKQTDYRDAEAAHSLRKNAKKVRYDAAAFGNMLNMDAAETASRMKKAQNKLGDLCDARVNQGIVTRFMDRDLSSLAKEQAQAFFDQQNSWEKSILADLCPAEDE